MQSKNSGVTLHVIVLLALFLGQSIGVDEPDKRLQGIAVSGRLLCGQRAMNATKIKIVDLDKSREIAFAFQILLCSHQSPAY